MYSTSNARIAACISGADVYIYRQIYICVYTHTHIYIYIYNTHMHTHTHVFYLERAHRGVHQRCRHIDR